MICSVFSVTLTGACPKSVGFIQPFHRDIRRYLFVAVGYGRKVTNYTENSQTCMGFPRSQLLVTHLIQYSTV